MRKSTLAAALLTTVAGYAAASENSALPVFFLADDHPLGATRFMAKGSGMTAYFLPGEVEFRIAGGSVRMSFAGANPQAQIEGVDRLKAVVNLMKGPETEWLLGLPAYRTVTYRDLYPGIQMVYGAVGGRLKTEFVVAPGADPSCIRIQYSGATRVYVGEDGSLLIEVNGQELREEAPSLYQDKNKVRIPVAGRFTVARDGTVGFLIERYDAALPLVIDPLLSYSTLLGGSDANPATAVAVDSTGAAYVAGYTASVDFPIATPAQPYNAGGNDIFVAKLGPSGNELIYCTYLGGTGDDRAAGIAVDDTGAAYVTGSTTSQNFPVRNAIQPFSAGGKDAFIVKLSPSGNSLDFATYLGGSSSDAATGIAIDAAHNSYVIGDTSSSNFPSTSAAFQKSYRGAQDAFVVKVSAAGSLVYSTFLGGGNIDHGGAIAVDSTGGVYVTGSTYSSDFPVAAAFQSSIAGGEDAFIAKLNPNGTSLVYSTYLGGSGGSVAYPETGQGIAVDAQGNVYVTGVTSSSNFPQLHPLQGALSGFLDVFVAKLNAAGSLQYSTYLGGSGIDVGNGIAVDQAGEAVVVGYTFSTDLPVTANAFQSYNAGDCDAFIAMIGAAGNTLLFLTYLGGTGSDTASAVALDSLGNAYVAGWTQSPQFPVVNAYQTVNAGNYHAFVSKVTLASETISAAVTPSSGSGSSQTFAVAVADSGGANAVSTVYVLINSTLSAPSACFIAIYPGAGNPISLVNSAASGWLGPSAAGSGSPLSNGECTVNAGGTSLTASGNQLVINLPVAFTPAFAGTKNVYVYATDAASKNTGWVTAGTWAVAVAGGLGAVSVVPASGSGSSQTFAVTVADSGGANAIGTVYVLINSTLNAPSACFIAVYPGAGNSISLVNSAASGWLGPSAAGSGSPLSNGECTVNAGGASLTASGNQLVINLPVVFTPAFAGTKNVYVYAADTASQNTGWLTAGTWAVAVSGSLGAVSVVPASGSGSSQTFAVTVADSGGANVINTVYVLINSALSAPSACFIAIYPNSGGSMSLVNNAASGWLGPSAAGSGSPLANSQCSLNAGQASVTVAGNQLVISLPLTFTPAFRGPKNVFVEAIDNASQNTGWQSVATWTVT